MDATAAMELNRCTGSMRAARAARERRPIPPTTLTMPGCVVPYLRRGVLWRLSDALTTLSIEVASVPLDMAKVQRGMARLDETRALLDVIGAVDAPRERDLDLEISRWPVLILGALRSEHLREIGRREDAAVDGYTIALGDVAVLGEMVAQVRRALDGARHRSQLGRRPRLRGADENDTGGSTT